MLQKGHLRAGCRFALRVAKTPEDYAAIQDEIASHGVEWTKYEVPEDLDREDFPGLRTAASDGPAASAGTAGTAAGAAVGVYDGGGGGGGDLLPGIGPVVTAAVVGGGGGDAGAVTVASVNGGEGDEGVARIMPAPVPAVAVAAAAVTNGDGEGGGDLYVALQGWVAHDADHAEVRLRPPRESGAGRSVGATEGLAGQVRFAVWGLLFFVSVFFFFGSV